ncbi:hypothetical protein ACC782_33535 [Rhizobium ruizarguesonis]
MAKYDQGGGCACGLKRECDCTKVMTFSPEPYNDIGKQHRQIMVEGFGALPVVPPKYVAANDNVEGRMPLADALGDWYAPTGGQYIGLRRHTDIGARVVAAVEKGIADRQASSRPLSSDDGQVGGFDIPPALQPAFAELARTGDFMQTATGRKFWPLDPRAEEVFIDDIAHSLSLQCRYAGHCLRFYSVAEHCVLMARKLRWEGVDVALYALLHDAAEAYTVDVPRPLKRSLVGYKEAEAKVMAVIAERFGMADEMPAVVHDADNRIIGDELANLVPMDWHARYAGQELGVELRYWSPEKAREEFMATFDALMDNRARGMA